MEKTYQRGAARRTNVTSPLTRVGSPVLFISLAHVPDHLARDIKALSIPLSHPGSSRSLSRATARYVPLSLSRLVRSLDVLSIPLSPYLAPSVILAGSRDVPL